MATTQEKRERQDRILAELSELGLELARDLQACALPSAPNSASNRHPVPPLLGEVAAKPPRGLPLRSEWTPSPALRELPQRGSD
jgi:hypothetical protein